MLKAIKKSIKKLGSQQRLDGAPLGATAAEAAAPDQPQPHHPPAGSGQAAPSLDAVAPQPVTLPHGEPRAGSAPLPPRPASPQQPPQGPPQAPRQPSMPLSVDYELVAGPLDLDCSLQHDAEAGDQHPEAGSPGDAAAEACGRPDEQQAAPDAAAAHGGADSPPSTRQQHVWHDSAQHSGSPSAEEEAAVNGGGGGGAAGAAEAAAAAEAAGLTAALETMMYLTEEGRGDCGNDCMSVVSDALSEDDLPDDISELSRALEALEGETLGSSPASAAGPASLGGAGSGSIDDQLAERLGISPDAGDPTAYSQQMAKLYNNLGLKMMERRRHEEALGLLRKAEAIVENEAAWVRAPGRRQRMRAITFNNLGCLYKRHNMPQVALQYLQKALALEEQDGLVQNSSSTHLNISAAFSALKRPKEALAHAERAIILLQSHLWPHHLPFQDGLQLLTRQLAAPGAPLSLLASANVLAMSYHNAAVEHEKLGRLREALVSFTRAHMIATKGLGPKAQMTGSLHRALKAFQQRQARHLPAGAAHAARKAPSLAAHPTKRALGSRGAGKPSAGSKGPGGLASKSMGSLAAAAANGKATLPLDKASRTVGAALAGRPPSASRLSIQLQQQ